MKKIISVALLLALCLSLFAGCNQEPAKTASNLPAAKEYLEGMYKADAVDTPVDYTLVGVVLIEGVSYNVDWTTNSDKITITRGDNKMVTIDVPDSSPEEIKYVLTATITDANGDTTTTSFNRRIPAAAAAGLTMEQIVEKAYELEDGEVMEGVATLTGVITMIKTPYDEGYQNITVIIQIGELTDKRIECYRMKGEGIADLCVGDTITVTGSLKNYGGTIEFDAGSTMDKVVPGDRVTAPTDPKDIVAAAYALAAGDALPYTATLTGVITTIDTPYDSGYKNVTFTIQVEGCEDKPMLCYRVKGDDAATVAVGDTVSVTGNIINYGGKIEFNVGSKVALVSKGQGGSTQEPEDKPVEIPDEKPTTKPSTPAAIVDAAYALADGKVLDGEYTLTGKVTSIKTAYDASFDNISVVIAVSGRETKPILCFRMKGTDINKIAVGDTITVTGSLKNYGGTIEFDAGCTMSKRVSGGVVIPTDPKQIVDAAFALEPGKSLPYTATLTGKIVKINNAYDSTYKNITVTIEVEGTGGTKELKCYRMKGEGAENLKAGDTITVTGVIKNYVHSSSGDSEIEFDTGCTFVKA